jgi:hypothetical protein
MIFLRSPLRNQQHTHEVTSSQPKRRNYNVLHITNKSYPTFSKTMAPTFETLAAAIVSFKPSKPRQTLDRTLASARRAELPLDPNFREGHKYENLLNVTHGPQIEDVIYICCCGAKNTISHFTGAHPFKFLKCRVCDQTFCNNCVSSEILTLIKVPSLPAFQATLTTASHLGQICADCGLTHRSVDKNVRCPCETQSNANWITFAILSGDKYKYDPNAAFVKLKLGRAMTAVEQRTQKSAPQPKCFDMPAQVAATCGLKRRGAIRRKNVVV